MGFDLMAFMESMAGVTTSNILRTFSSGLMNVSQRTGKRRHTVLTGFLCTPGLAATHMPLAEPIVYAGLRSQRIALFIQRNGSRLLGPFLVFIGSSCLI